MQDGQQLADLGVVIRGKADRGGEATRDRHDTELGKGD
jgi:hypothetical protein